jgi:hypothetical protein
MRTSPETLKTSRPFGSFSVASLDSGVTLHEGGQVSLLSRPDSESLESLLRCLSGTLDDLLFAIYVPENSYANNYDSWLSDKTYVKNFADKLTSRYFLCKVVSDTFDFATSGVSAGIAATQRVRNPTEEAERTILSLLYLGSDSIRDADLATVIRELSVLLAAGRWGAVDTIFDAAEPSKLSLEMILTLLRTSFTARHELSAWHRFLNRATEEITNRGQNPSKLLRGLNSPK